MKLLLPLFFFIYTSVDAQVIFQQYFPLKNGASTQYNVTINFKDDTPIETVEKRICRSTMIKGKNIFYFITADKEKESNNPTIGSELFASGVCYYDRGRFMQAPVYWKNDMNKAGFKILFPEKIYFDSIYTAIDDEETRKYKFIGFEKLQIAKKTLDSCLKLIVIQEWPENTHTDTVWFRKNTGVVKWDRSTGRIEEIVLK